MAHSITYPLERFKTLPTPFYYYDLALLRTTLDTIIDAIGTKQNYNVHYAIKANANPRILHEVAARGFGADCVSGGEIKAALAAGFPASKIVFAGVGKSDWEINLALDNHIQCFNVESIPELEVINQLATEKNVITNVAFRVNPNVDAHTHEKITTGLNENKFGIAMEDLIPAIKQAQTMAHVNYTGLHFHIGSQILDLKVFQHLCDRINAIQIQLEEAHITTGNINVGGGLGIDYEYPESNPVPDFKNYFDLFANHLKLHPHQQLHFELGRSIVAQCGMLIAKTLYVKQGHTKAFVIVDAGFTELIRPAMYGATHFIKNLTALPNTPLVTYDVVGPICESSDVFARDMLLPQTERGHLMAFLSAGAYGEVMASQYNCRQLPASYFSD